MRIYIVKKRTLLIGAAIILIIAAAIAAAVLLSRSDFGDAAPTGAVLSVPEEYELTVLGGRTRELPIYSVKRSDKAIALTIDAAWEDDKTGFILKTLKKFDVPATFFLCGVWVDTYPQHVKEIAKAGHEIGNHSKTHPHMNQLDKAAVQTEIASLDDEIERLTGKRCTLFRAPFGEYNDTVITASREIGYEPIQWNIDTIDTEMMT